MKRYLTWHVERVRGDDGSQAGTGFAGITYVEMPKSWLPT